MNTYKLYKNLSLILAALLIFTGLQRYAPEASAIGRTKIEISKRTKTSVTLKLSKVTGATGYQIFIAPAAAGKYKQVGASRTTSFLLTKLKQNKVYYVKVRTYHTSGTRITLGKYSKAVKVDKYVSLTTAEKYASEVLELVNEERENEGLDPLKANKSLNTAANIRAKELVELNSPTRPDGRNGCSVLTDEDIVYETAGENIASGVKTPEKVVEQWMNDPGHRAQIMSEDYTQMGLGYYAASDGDRYYWSQIFIN